MRGVAPHNSPRASHLPPLTSFTPSTSALLTRLPRESRRWDVYTPWHHICVTKGRIDGTRHRQCTAVGLSDGFAMTDFIACEANKVTAPAWPGLPAVPA